MNIVKDATTTPPITAPVVRTAVFIDGPNLRATEHRLGRRFAYDQLKVWLEARGKYVTTMKYFTTLRKRQPDEYASVENLLRWLRCNGFVVKTITLREYDSDQGRVFRGSVATSIVAEAIEIADSVDELFILSGDADLAPLVEVAQRRGCRVTVASTTDTVSMLSETLRAACDDTVDLSHAHDLFRPMERSNG